jgi:hypothetical protein
MKSSKQTTWRWCNGRLAARAAAMVVMCGALASAGGCGAESVAALGASAAQAGASYYSRGEFRSVELARFDDVVAAVQSASRKMSLTIRSERFKPGKASIVYADDRGEEIDVVLKRRSETVTDVKVDVGTFGSSGTGRLFLAQILDELSEAEAYVDTWNRDNPRGNGAGSHVGDQ